MPHVNVRLWHLDKEILTATAVIEDKQKVVYIYSEVLAKEMDLPIESTGS